MAESSWKKSPPELVAAFATYVHGRPELATRQMFGYPAAFLGGNLTTSLYQDRWIVRLADADAAALRDLGGQSFEPMPGRTMRGYVSLPPSVVADPASLDAWVARAIAHVRTLAPK
jgi:TfoX/Sxy family transcriptional regulator of competence genes